MCRADCREFIERARAMLSLLVAHCFNWKSELIIVELSMYRASRCYAQFVSALNYLGVTIYWSAEKSAP